MRHFRRSHRRSSSKRKVAWGTGAFTGSDLSSIPAGTGLFETFWIKVPAGALNTSVPPDGAIEPQDWTLIRSFNSVSVTTAAAVGGYVQSFFCAGLIVWEGMSDVAPSILDVPSPAINADADWIWRWVTPNANFYGAAGIITVSQNLFGPELNVQSRAMRKLSARQGLLAVVGIDNSLSLNGTVGLNFAYDFRGAFKLP